MKPPLSRTTDPLPKARTGIPGFDEITRGGLPRGRVTLVEGGPGCGKTVFALQWLVNGARLDREAGIFVAFEESAERLKANAVKFGWDLAELEKKKLFFLDAQPAPDLVHSGGFDLSGLLAALAVKAREIHAQRIVFDAIDVILALLDDPVAERREIHRLHTWLLDHGYTAVITAKAGRASASPTLDGLQFMVDCAVALHHEAVQGISQRHLRVIKYRGSEFSENAAPLLIGPTGLEVAGGPVPGPAHGPVSTERVSSGVARLDAMLGGGYFRGASILITGFPGTAKSTLSGAFAAAACQRGERTLFVSFDSEASEVVRNLASVRIALARHVKSGLLRLVSARTIAGSAETHLMQIKRLAADHQARCVVIDPISALAKAGNETLAHGVAERLVDWAKGSGLTLLCTSLLDANGQQFESTPLQISTLADTWLHLNYLVQAGERNRGLSIVKSRGTAHSNQVRELILSDHGVTLADAFTAGGEVLMGTLRWEKERAVRTSRAEAEVAAQNRQRTLDLEALELETQLKTLHQAIEAKRAEQQALACQMQARETEFQRDRSQLHTLRGSDEK